MRKHILLRLVRRLHLPALLHRMSMSMGMTQLLTALRHLRRTHSMMRTMMHLMHIWIKRLGCLLLRLRQRLSATTMILMVGAVVWWHRWCRAEERTTRVLRVIGMPRTDSRLSTPIGTICAAVVSVQIVGSGLGSSARLTLSGRWVLQKLVKRLNFICTSGAVEPLRRRRVAIISCRIGVVAAGFFSLAAAFRARVRICRFCFGWFAFGRHLRLRLRRRYRTVGWQIVAWWMEGRGEGRSVE